MILGHEVAYSGVRRLLVLIKALPPESAFARSATQGWTDAQELRATQVELTHALYRATLAAAGSKRVPRQLRVPRPRPARREASTDEVVAFFGAGR